MTKVQAYSAFATVIRRVNQPRRFNRTAALIPLKKEVVSYWSDGLDALFAFLSLHEGWKKIQRHIQLEVAADSFARSLRKAMTDSDKTFIANLLTNFDFFGDVDKQAKTIVEGTSFDTFNEAAKFALQQIGVGAPDFELKNEQIREKLLDRTSAAVFATRNHIDSVFDTIVNQFYDLGRNPYNADFIQQLRGDLDVKTDWQAQRFALTETGIASEVAQVETYRRNGVENKRWNVTGQDTREDHADLSGAVIGIADAFDCGGYSADHPLDPSLPADELVNCHCWISPIVSDDFEIDPDQIWEGA
jgi:hypothetical protein